MTDKELKKLNRRELLEMLIEQSKEVERLRAEIQRKDAQLREKEIRINSAGSIAQAALEINKIFEVAQAAADQYLENVARDASETVSDITEKYVHYEAIKPNDAERDITSVSGRSRKNYGVSKDIKQNSSKASVKENKEKKNFTDAQKDELLKKLELFRASKNSQ